MSKNALFKEDQIISIVPQNFKNADKGKIIKFDEKSFSVESFHDTKNLQPNVLIEFYSQTQHGVLYFKSDILEIDGNILKIANPARHRFLQRRAFTRIKFVRDLSIQEGSKSYQIKSVDLSAGGMKLQTDANINIESEYDINIELSAGQTITSKFQPIRIEKRDNVGEGSYILSGSFKTLSSLDKMKLVQFCMKKKTEQTNKQL